MSNRKEGTSEEERVRQLGVNNLHEWDKIHNLSILIKQGKAKIVRDNGAPHTVIKENNIFRCEK